MNDTPNAQQNTLQGQESAPQNTPTPAPTTDAGSTAEVEAAPETPAAALSTEDDPNASREVAVVVEGLSEKVLETVKALAGRSSYADLQDRADEKQLMEALAEDFRPQGVHQWLYARAAAHGIIEELKTERAKSAHLRLMRPMAAREILAPGYAEFAPGGRGYARQGDAFVNFTGTAGKAASALSDEEAIAGAVQKLATLNMTERVIDDVALRLAAPEIERLDRLAASYRRERDRALNELRRAQAAAPHRLA